MIDALRKPRILIAALVTALLALAMSVVMSGGSATARNPGAGPNVPAPPAVPVRDSQLQNIGQVATAIKAYYGDTVSGTNPDGTPQHLASATGNYAKQVIGIEKGALKYLAAKARSHPGTQHKNAIVLDVDDTSLSTYNYEIDSSFVYNATANALFVNSAAFPAVFGMPQLTRTASAEGYTIFFITGRPEAQRPGTVTNLTNVGFPAVPSNQLYLKDQTNQPWLSGCSPTCTTIQYKSLTRKHIESLGYTITANFGDQYSDLEGGYSNASYKLPNPMYYLP